MARTIESALFHKASQMDELVTFSRDFAAATGLSVEFINESGSPSGHRLPVSNFCRLVQSSPAGQRLCQLAHRDILAAATSGPAAMTCDAGCVEAAVPLCVSGMVIGYFKISGVTPRPLEGAALHRIEHLLRKAGVVVDLNEFKTAAAGVRSVSSELLWAHLRIVDIVAQQISLRITAQLTHPADSIPAVVARACREVRRRALTDDIRLDEIASHCGVSASHLSRTFHRATGLTFREYVGRWRAEHAYSRVVGAKEPITEIAYSSGFQSLSQFNRVFRVCYGKSPRQIRREHRRSPEPV